VATTRTRLRLRTIGWVVLVAALVAPIFNLATAEASVGSALQGLVDGVLTALVVGGWSEFVRDGLLRARFRRLGFSANLVLNGSAFLLLFLVARALGQLATSGDPRRFATSFVDPHLAYAIPFFTLVAFAAQFLIQMNRMVSTNVLGYYLAGVYHRPKAEERIFPATRS
jgi:hypothetical protein